MRTGAFVLQRYHIPPTWRNKEQRERGSSNDHRRSRRPPPGFDSIGTYVVVGHPKEKN